MKENEMFYISIDELGVSQLYLNQDKVDNVLAWFNPLRIDEYEPLPVYDFLKNGKFVLTDGHTRAYVLYKSGVSQIPVVIDNDEIVTCELGIKSYKEYIEWCNRLCINTVKDLENRIIYNKDYMFLWIERCDRLYNLMIKMYLHIIMKVLQVIYGHITTNNLLWRFSMDWNSKQYLKFKTERTQPAIDLANRINFDNPKKMIDIGCGPGNSTQVLSSRYPSAYILGVDKSEDMISSAKKDHPNLDFMICDVNVELPQFNNKFDIVFSNACIQWIPDHKQLIRNMLNLCNTKGILAVQIPMNYEEPIHKIIGEASTSDKWKEFFVEPRVFYTLSQGEYFDLLSEICDDFDIWETVYYHVMESYDDILEWYRGTGLRPYLDVLPDHKKKEFESDIMINLIKRYPKQKNGDIIFKFPRFFFTAHPKR